ncbi:MAG: pilus assembly protein PilM [Candidatus Neomarinimicrobiota bacterium]
MSKKDKKKILATNRLLEILRAEHGSKDAVSSEETKVDSDYILEDEAKELQSVAKSESSQKSEITEPEKDEIAHEPLQDIDEGDDVGYDVPVENVDPEVVKLAAALTTPESESTSSSQYAEDSKDNLLQKSGILKDVEKSSTKDIVLPPEFNDSLMSSYEGPVKEPGWKSRLRYLKRYFADNKRKITIYIDNNTIYLLQTLITLKETEVEKAKYYSLPYEYDNHIITVINDLLMYILENEIDPKDKKLSFGAYFSMKTPSKTIVIKSPKLKKKELTELVEWNASKNLPFSTENKSVNWKFIKSETEGDTHDVIIGVTETDSVNNIESIFSRNNINLRFTSTLPILLWKTFVKNYPDKNMGSYVIIHLGEARTLVVVVTDHILQFSRRIALGAQDFYKAIIQKVEKDESEQLIDIALAKEVLCEYGYPRNQTGIAANCNIDLNRINIAIRPVVERIISELNQTLNYFKNQKSDLEWNELLFGGVVASFPGILEAIQEDIYQKKVELFNPVRIGEYYFRDDVNITPQQYPNYFLNFALATDEVTDFNVATIHIRENYKYLFLSKIIVAILAVIIPFFLFTGLHSNSSLKRGHRAVEVKKSELQRLSVATRDYAGFVGDIKIINSTNHFLRNDRIYSENQLKMLKLFATIVPEKIKLTSLNFINAAGLPDSVVTAEDFKEHIEIAGFVNEDKSVADIYLTDFILQLERTRYFSNVRILEKSDTDIKDKSELFFTLYLSL